MNARPFKQESEKQTSQMIFKCSAQEKQEIERLAKLHGHSKTSDYMRRACLGYEKVNRDKLDEK